MGRKIKPDEISLIDYINQRGSYNTTYRNLYKREKEISPMTPEEYESLIKLASQTDVNSLSN